MVVRSTTVLCVRRNMEVAMACDGQVTMNDVVVKNDALKLRKLAGGKILLGVTGSTGEVAVLLDRLDNKLVGANGNLRKAAAELAKEWRTDPVLRGLEPTLLVADYSSTLILAPSGDVIDPEDGIAGIGTAGAMAATAARALLAHTQMGAREIAVESVKLAGQACVYANTNVRVDTL
ncbi:MAG: ATP-dependent protease subunit HslV [Tepidisphaeraceae bacterium]